MIIQEFKKQLSRRAGKDGGTFYRADFHVHLPGSSDCEYKAADAFEQLAKALTDGRYGTAVILKHQEFPTKDELKKLQDLCPNTLLIPGAEINVFVDALMKKVTKDHYYHCVVAADPSTEWAYPLQKAKENLSYSDTGYPSGFHSNIRDVAWIFTDAGALFIPAHLHQSKPPNTSRSIDDIYDDSEFLRLVDSGVFSALEVREASTARFFEGSSKTKEGTPIPAAVCVQSSDAHNHQHIIDRNRSTWVQMERPSFSELKAALKFRHRVSLDCPSFTHSQVVGLHVVGAFLKDEWVAFNPGINCLIGCKGSGKTSILECLRFVLNTDIPTDQNESVQKHLQHILGPAGYVECLVRRSDGTEAIIVRRSDSVSRIKIVEQDKSTREIEANRRSGFDVAILGWHEIEAVADHASARMRLLDRIQGEEPIRGHYATIEQSIESARDLLPTLQRRVKRLDESLRQLWELQKKRDTLKKLDAGALLDLQTQYKRHLACEQELKTLKHQVQRAAEEVARTGNTAYQFQSSSEKPDASFPGVVRNARADADGCLSALHAARDAAMDNLANTSTEAVRRLDKQIEVVHTAFASFRQNEYEPKVNELPAEEREILSRQIQIIEETKSLPDIESQCRALQAEVRTLAGQMHAICDSVCGARQVVCSIRQANIAAINSELPTIRLTFQRSANHARRQGFQNSYRDDAGSFFGFVESFGRAESYENLRGMFAQLQQVEIEQEKWSVKELLLDARWVEFLKILDDDDVQIEMQVGQAGFVPIQNLSAGQRCTAVFPLLLRNTRGPLVIDQPEDNLDNRYIADVIAPDLLQKKRQQQFIATSHNVNLVVLTDSDLIIHADSDGKTGKLVCRGFFACSGNDIGKSVLDVLDGGEQALLARQRKYGTWNQ
jgi:DNA repair ATPase RecN